MYRFYIILISLLCISEQSRSQAYIDFIEKPCPASDILSVCIGDDNSYDGKYNFRTYDHFCGEEITGTLSVYRDQKGEYFLDDFSFGTWTECYGIDGPSGTLRLNIDCNEVIGISGTDNYGDVWGTSEVIYTGSSFIISWFNTYSEFGTTELTPLDGHPINEPSSILESEYSFLWSTGETSQTIQTTDLGEFFVEVYGPNGFYHLATLTIFEDLQNFELTCTDQILEVSYFNDDNKNGIQDAGESSIYNGAKYIQLTPQQKLFAYEGEMKERYVLLAQDYDISVVHPDFKSTNLPLNLNVTPSQGLIPLSIGLYPINEVEDVHIDITSGSIERCNTLVPFYIKIKNTGTVPFNNKIHLKFDPIIEYKSAGPDPSSISPGKLTWDIYIPDHSGEIKIVLLVRMPDELSVDEQFCLVPESGGFEKSSDSYCFKLSCAIDPNDKHGTPFRGDRNFTLFEEELKYTIRFENLGNDTAFNVRVEDQLDPSLDLSTYRFIQSSHEVNRQFIDQNRNLIFDFKDIMLPSVEQDSVANKGFVQFAIKSLPNLVEESPIENTAEIYFDFNDLVITNTTQHLMVSELETSSVDALHRKDLLKFSVYPNPVQDQLMLQYNNPENLNLYFNIVDIAGKSAKSGRLKSRIINLEELQSGMYFLKVYDSKQSSALVRFVKE